MAAARSSQPKGGRLIAQLRQGGGDAVRRRDDPPSEARRIPASLARASVRRPARGFDRRERGLRADIRARPRA